MTMSIRKLCTIGLGIALYVVLALCLQVPVFENYYLCLGYVAMAVYCYSFGPWAGAAVGGLGVVLYCLLINGLRGMPGWAMGNLIIGIALGLTFRVTRNINSAPLRWVLDALAVAIATAVGILIVKSFTEVVLYAQPMAVRVAKNVSAFLADVVMLLVSLPLCIQLDKALKQHFPGLLK